MLNEIIRNVEYDNIIKKVKETVKMDNSLYVRIPIDRELNIEKDILLIKKEVEITQLEQSEWFKNRQIYCNRINANKSIVKGGLYSMFVSSCNPNCIMFNWDNFLKHKNTDKENLSTSFETMINEFLTKLEDEGKRQYFTKSFNDIREFILNNQLTKFTLYKCQV